MKKVIFLTSFCLIALFSFANNYRGDDRNYKYEKEKLVETAYNVTADPNLIMDGKYSDFIISVWDKSQIDFKVKVLVRGNNEEKVMAKFNSIEINLEQNGNNVYATTAFGDFPYRSFDGSISIKYYVKVPADVAMDLITKYGDITIDEVNRRLKVDLKYGDLKADNINIENLFDNSITVKYGDIHISDVKKLYLQLDYGNARINKCEHIEAEIKYSNIVVSELNEGILDNKYSTSRIESAETLRFTNAAYSDLFLINVNKELQVDMRYSDLKAYVASKSPIINIDGQYSDTELHLSGESSFNYNLDASYGDITFKGFFDTKTVKSIGTYGNGEPGRINISVKYGDVDIIEQ